MEENDIIERLKDDDQYYNGVGRDYLSASDIGNILEGTYTKIPDRSDWKPHFEIGKYFHVQTLEPHKLDTFDVRDVKRRMAGEQFLKQNEVWMCEDMKKSHDADINARGILYGPDVQYEIPAITTIEGIPFKGKCDILNPAIGYLGDLKSTSNLQGFDDSIRKWYCPQLWIYWKLFGLPTAYIAVDKRSLETEVIFPEQHFYAQGKAMVLEAIQIYKNTIL